MPDPAPTLPHRNAAGAHGPDLGGPPQPDDGPLGAFAFARVDIRGLIRAVEPVA